MEAFIIVPAVLALIGFLLYKLDRWLLKHQVKADRKRRKRQMEHQIREGQIDAQILREILDERQGDGGSRR